MNSIDCALYSDPQLYDLLFPGARDTESVHDPVRSERIIASERFYVEEARRSGGRVLELGCGSGRLTVPIAKRGFEICGADLSEPMLDAAQLLADARVDVVVWNGTSGAWQGLDRDRLLVDRIRRDLGTPATTALASRATIGVKGG